MTENRNRWYTGRPWTPGYDISRHQTEFATNLRIPFLTTPFPRRDYRFGVVVNTDDNALWRGEVPTDEEVEVIANVRNAYTDYFFSETNAFRAEMEAFAPYDVEGGKPCYYFVKNVDGSWAYRRSQWNEGPYFRPSYPETTMTLAEVIELAELHYERLERFNAR